MGTECQLEINGVKNTTMDANGQALIGFLENLAPEGETMLFVRQKRAAGEHGDGTPKYVWIPYLDTRKMREGEAWYVNSGSFILDRFRDGKPHAGKDYCERVALLLCDDVGTKSKVPPLEPTWKMETSPGNFQWVYVFGIDDQPLNVEYCAVIRAVADAGYTDGGATNPVRNIRLPGSVNLKPGRDNFAARLVEFHPEREFTLPQICEAFNVTPSEGAAQHTAIRVKDDGSDDVLAWLSANALVLERANGSGWFGVVCPNAAEHSDGATGARYLPATRAFCCYHEHCQEWTSAKFLDWVAEQGGPVCKPGLRDDLMAHAMQSALEKLPETNPMFSEEMSAKAIAEQTEQRELGRIQKEQWYAEYAYVLPDDSYFSLTTRQELSRRAFDALYRHIACKTIHGEKKAKVSASYAFDESRQTNGARVLNGIAYAPGESVIVTRNGDAFGNRWKDARQQGVPGDISPWLEHWEQLVPDQEQREHIFNVMAYKLQNPSVKINHAILMGGAPGCGKDTAFAPFIWAVCGPGLHNYALVDGERIESQWGYHYESEIFVLNELKEPEARERRALANKLKPVIAAPPDVLSVNRKGLAPYDAANRLQVLAFTNDYNPISIESDDRRWFCVWSPAPRMADGRAIWNWYQSGGYEACAAWLWARDVTAFNPAAPAPMTDFKRGMIESSLSATEAAIMRLIEEGKGEFGKGVVASPWQSVAERIALHMPETGRRAHPSAIVHALKESGWVDCGRLGSAAYQTKKHIFCRPDMVRHTKSELRNMVEEGPLTPALALVK